jgi:hypothetical protein
VEVPEHGTSTGLAMMKPQWQMVSLAMSAYRRELRGSRPLTTYSYANKYRTRRLDPLPCNSINTFLREPPGPNYLPLGLTHKGSPTSTPPHWGPSFQHINLWEQTITISES